VRPRAGAEGEVHAATDRGADRGEYGRHLPLRRGSLLGRARRAASRAGGRLDAIDSGVGVDGSVYGLTARILRPWRTAHAPRLANSGRKRCVLGGVTGVPPSDFSG